MADPLKLVILLYQGALDSIATARKHMAGGDVLARVRAINRATAIVRELIGSLDHTQGGEISTQLSQLYNYILRKLIEANLNQSEAPLAEAGKLLNTLLEGWQECRNAIDLAAQKSPRSMGIPESSSSEYEPLSCTF